MLTFEYKFEFSVILWQLVLIFKGGPAYNSLPLLKKDTCITLHYITLHYITLHYITLHYITLHYITLHYITLHYNEDVNIYVQNDNNNQEYTW